MIDTHAHIYTKEFKDDLAGVIGNCQEKGVEKIFMPNIDEDSIELMLEVERKYPEMCFSMMGLHPSSVNKTFQKQLYDVESWLGKRKFIAVGEIGIDLYWDKSLQAFQEEAFKIQIMLAKKHRLPIVIHCREAFEETISIVEDLYDETLTGVFHCFSGSLKEAERVTDLGFYLGIGGVVTFKNGSLDKVIPDILLESIVLETDSPYLSPAPYRGKRNEPANVSVIAKKIADLKETEIGNVIKATTKNAEKLFSIV